MDQYIGKFLDDRYELLERIGTGGMAMVYKAKCHWLNRFVAVKILKEDLAQDEEFCRRFHEESQAIAMLSHPNIVSVYDVSHTPGLDYIVMELIEGITLKQYMQKRGGKLNWKESLHFITQIMKGLSHAHSRGIIHRDIKPHNIMVLRDGSVKVTDFGIARLMSSSQSTMTQEALGSVHYISPEQARGSRIDERSDIYSAGVVLYEMLTGRLPYEGESPVAVAIQHINSIPLSPREIDPSIPEAIEEITMKAMASDPDKRYSSAEAMLADLEEFRKNPNISFDYTQDDLMVGEGDEPTQNVKTAPPAVVPVHDHRREDKSHAAAERKQGRKRAPRAVEEEYDDEYEEGGNRGIWIAAVAVLLVAGMVAIGMFLWNTVFRDMVAAGQTYVVPDLYNYTLEEARLLPAVTENGFTVVEGSYISDETVPEGHIISQSPAANEVVKAGGQEITVTISVGDSALSMPDLYNKDRRVAETMLANMGLQVTVMESSSDEITKGNVVSQTPAAHESVEKGATVTIVVSLGRQLKDVQMISLINLSLDEATRIITEDLGLRVGSVVPETSDLAEGQVCYQSIEPYTLVKEETVVDLRVSTGTGIALPPNTTQTSQPSHSPELSPAPSASAEPTASVPPEPPAPVSRRKDGTVRLPSDRETVTVRVTVNGVQQYNEPINTQMRIAHFTIEGTGTQEVVVYIDDVETDRYMEDFGS